MNQKSVGKCAVVALPLSVLLASCQDYEPFSKEEVAQSVVNHEYVKNFEDRYGLIDPNHSWGLGPIEGGEADVTRGTNVNSNEWDSRFHLDIPGYPDRYFDKNGAFHSTYYRGENSYADSKSTAGTNPKGDVTDEEVMYVSWWFRTHRYPESLDIHWTDFWIQDISSDNDRDADGYLVNYLPEYKFDSGLNAQQNTDFTIDQLKVKTFDGSESGGTHDFFLPGYDHINNFNSGSTNHLTRTAVLPMNEANIYDGYSFEGYGDIRNGDRTQWKQRTIQFYNSSGTEDFAAHYSQDQQWRYNEQERYDHSIWVLVHLHFVGQSGRIYDGYYLGFDYAMEKDDQNGIQELKMDGYYSNWIVKLSPGTAYSETSETWTRRIMCEDLGNSFDFDFDDVVFDVKYNMTADEHRNYQKGQDVDITVTVQAAGGTMPIYVGIDPNLRAVTPEKVEAHRLFGQPTTSPVNVGARYAKAPEAIYHLTVQSIEPADIPIFVYNTKTDTYMNLNTFSTDVYKKDGENVPQKFGAPTSVLWMQENAQIEEGYGQFASWVADDKAHADWYTKDVNKSKLWGTAGQPSATTTTTFGGISSTIQPNIPVSGSQGFNYNVYMKVGKGEVRAIATNLTKGQEVTIEIPADHDRCQILGSYRIDDQQYRSASNTVNTITETTTIKVDGNVYIWSYDRNKDK